MKKNIHYTTEIINLSTYY